MVLTIKAVEERVRRRLQRDLEYLRKPRSRKLREDLGDYYIANHKNIITAWRLDIVALAKDLHLIGPGETVQGESGHADQP